MSALNLDLTVEQGATWWQSFLLNIDGEPALTTGWTARAQARYSVSHPETLHEWSTELGNIVIDPDTHQLTMSVGPADSSAWTWRSAHYDLEVTSPDGDVIRMLEGRIRVSPEVTRD